MDEVGRGLLDWAVVAKPASGQMVSGDLHLVAPFPGGTLVAVIDGLGHGLDAQQAARTAVEALRKTPGQPVEALVQDCHRALGRLRGAVMSLASFDAARARLTWIGVGNVEGVLFQFDRGSRRVIRQRLLVWGGIVGQSLPALRPATLHISPGDTLVFATDGLKSAFADDLRPDGAVEDVSNGVLAKHATGKDDALVLAARYVGGSS